MLTKCLLINNCCLPKDNVQYKGPIFPKSYLNTLYILKTKLGFDINLWQMRTKKGDHLLITYKLYHSGQFYWWRRPLELRKSIKIQLYGVHLNTV